ncbi:putative mitochondrial protein, partial [Mucuna pruriens]
MPLDFGGSTIFNVFNLTPCDAVVEAPNLRKNSLQEREDDVYIEKKTPTLEGPIAEGRLRRIQEEELLNKFKLEDCKSMCTLMHPMPVLTLNDSDKKVDQTIDCDNTNLGLLFKESNEYKLAGFSDVDYAGDKMERKITSGGCHIIGANLVSWSSKRQGTIGMSTVEA